MSERGSVGVTLLTEEPPGDGLKASFQIPVCPPALWKSPPPTRSSVSTSSSSLLPDLSRWPLTSHEPLLRHEWENKKEGAECSPCARRFTPKRPPFIPCPVRGTEDAPMGGDVHSHLWTERERERRKREEEVIQLVNS